MPRVELTGYAKALKEKSHYPLKKPTPWKKRKPNKRRPVPTPFLVVPNFPGDDGAARPLSEQRARASAAIDIVETNSNSSVTTPLAGRSYSLHCRIVNRGAVGCYAGIAEFYVASPAVLDAFANGTGPRPAPLGYGGFMVAPGGQTIVVCQRQWSVTDLNSAILVRAYDPLIDRAPAGPYNSAVDRHLARRDIVPDFTGTYLGKEKFVSNPASIYDIKIVIQQTNNEATISIYPQVGGAIPASPHESGGTLVTGNSFVFHGVENRNGQPFTSNVWTFRLTGPNTLHFDHHKHFLPSAGGGRPDIDFIGDLTRV